MQKYWYIDSGMPADDEQKQKDELSSTTDDGHSSGNSQDDVLGVDVPSASCSGSKRKRDGLDIPASNTASLPSWVVGNFFFFFVLGKKENFILDDGDQSEFNQKLKQSANDVTNELKPKTPSQVTQKGEDTRLGPSDSAFANISNVY